MKHIQINSSVIVSVSTFAEFIKYFDGTYSFHRMGWTKGKSGYELFCVDPVGIVYYHLIKKENKKDIQFFEENYKKEESPVIPCEEYHEGTVPKGTIKSEEKIYIHENIYLKYFKMRCCWDFYKKGDKISLYGFSKDHRMLFMVKEHPVFFNENMKFGEVNTILPKESMIKIIYHHASEVKSVSPFSIGYVFEKLNYANNNKG